MNTKSRQHKTAGASQKLRKEGPTIPTRQQILRDFEYLVEERGSNREFQLERVIRRWQACAYPLAELPVLLTVTLAKVLEVARKLEEAEELEAWNESFIPPSQADAPQAADDAPEDVMHEESGCTDYLQHTWASCPENKSQGKPELSKNDPNLNWAMYNAEKANPKPQAQHSPLPECDHELGLYGVCKKCNAWPPAIERAERALNGDSNDEEHDALIELIQRAKEDEQRIETLVNHAEALAEALRQIKSAMEHHFAPYDRHWCIAKATEALANWEGATK